MSDKLVVFVTPTGHYHANNSCSGMGRWQGKTSNQQATLTREEYEQQWMDVDNTCKCLRYNTWGQELAKRELRKRLAERRNTFSDRKYK